MTQPFRLPAGGLVDRSRPLAFEFDGSALRGIRRRHARVRAARERRAPRRPAASSITARAASSPPAARSRTRWCSSARGARTEPNVRATLCRALRRSRRREPEPLAVARASTSGPSTTVLVRLLPAGFYYKTFMWPATPRWWLRYEHCDPRAPRAWAARRSRPIPIATSTRTRTATCSCRRRAGGPRGGPRGCRAPARV